MTQVQSLLRSLLILLALVALEVHAAPLPSWQEGSSKSAIIKFVSSITDAHSKGYIPPEQRIAVFDNDGTLWSEYPLYFQAFFILDRIKALAPKNPQWKTEEPFASVLKGDTKQALAGGEEALLKMMAATHAGMTDTEFTAQVKDWMTSARHPGTGRPYTQMVYQPMLELLVYLRENGFKTFIVSGGGIEFMRAWAEPVYGIPPEQIIGSRIKTKFEMVEGKPTIIRLPELEFLDDKAGKPIGIHQAIGRRPLMAFGNSDGDLQMLQWTMAGEGARFAALVHHTDAKREAAYDRDSPIGKLDKALDIAKAQGWTVIDMQQEWKIIHPEKH